MYIRHSIWRQLKCVRLTDRQIFFKLHLHGISERHSWLWYGYVLWNVSSTENSKLNLKSFRVRAYGLLLLLFFLGVFVVRISFIILVFLSFCIYLEKCSLFRSHHIIWIAGASNSFHCECWISNLFPKKGDRDKTILHIEIRKEVWLLLFNVYKWPNGTSRLKRRRRRERKIRIRVNSEFGNILSLSNAAS